MYIPNGNANFSSNNWILRFTQFNQTFGNSYISLLNIHIITQKEVGYLKYKLDCEIGLNLIKFDYNQIVRVKENSKLNKVLIFIGIYNFRVLNGR